MKSRGETVAVVQAAHDAERLGRELDVLFDRMEHTDSQLLDWRVEAGQKLTEARKGFPLKGPKSAAWGEFLKARKLSQGSATRYMRLAVFVAEHPALRGEPVHVIYERMGEAAGGWSRESSSAGRFSGQQPLLTARTDTAPTIEVREGPATREQAERDAEDLARELAERPAGQRATLFDDGPGADLASKPLPPARTAAPAATTIVLPTEEPCPAPAPEPAPATAPSTDTAPDPVSLSSTGGRTSSLASAPVTTPIRTPMMTETLPIGSADEQAARSAALDAELVDQQEQLASGEEVRPGRRAAAKVDDPYEVAERIALLKTSPVSRVPDADRPAFAAALREWADGLAAAPSIWPDLAALLGIPRDLSAEEIEGTIVELRSRAEAAEARVRELEADVQRWIALGKEAGTRIEELEAALAGAEAGLAERDRVTARRGYQQGEAEALGWVAQRLCSGLDLAEMTAGELRDDIEGWILRLSARAERGDRAGYAAAEIDADARQEAREERRRVFAAALGAKQAATDEHAAANGCLVAEASPDAPEFRPGALLYWQSDGTVAPAQAELTYERDPERPRAAPKRAAKGKAPKLTTPAQKWHAADQVIDPKGRRAVVAFADPDGRLFLYLRPDPTAKRKAATGGPYLAGQLRGDPAQSAEGREQGRREAIEYMEGLDSPPTTWIAALRAAGGK